MGSHMIDFKLFRNSFGTGKMRKVFNEESFLQKTLDVEVALAKAQAKLNIIPKSVADEIEQKAKVENLNVEKLEKDIGKAKHPLVPILKQVEEICENEAGQYIHLGATTQDIIDTVTVLQLKEAYFIILEELKLVQDQLLFLAEKHKSTIMAGRTHRQQALPITFGYKVAIWLEEFNRHIERMLQIKP